MSQNAKFRELTVKSTLYNDKYIIEKVLGIGGFGITYYARHATLHKYYAIKEFFINGSCVRDTQTKTVHLQGITEEDYECYKQKFIEEAQTLAKLDHPNIVRVIDVFEENNTSYIVMPFVEGITLQQLVQQKGRLDYETAVNYIAQLSEAIAYVHEHDILHRDIKPDNIIITPNNRIVLIDFGSARTFIHDVTQRHTTVLSKHYAPLEQYSETAKKGSYSDIYSLGAVFYFTLTGRKPVDAAARTIETMPEPKDLLPAISPEVNAVILKAMQLKPELRHQTASEFMDDLLGETETETEKTNNAVPKKQEMDFLLVAKTQAINTVKSLKTLSLTVWERIKINSKVWYTLAGLFLFIIIVLSIIPLIPQKKITPPVADEWIIDEVVAVDTLGEPADTIQDPITASTQTFPKETEKTTPEAATIYINGNKYTGQTKNGNPHGKGTMTYMSKNHISLQDNLEVEIEAGERITGTWSNGNLDLGTLYDKNNNKKKVLIIGN